VCILPLQKITWQKTRYESNRQVIWKNKCLFRGKLILSQILNVFDQQKIEIEAIISLQKSRNYIAVSLFTGQCKYKTQRLAGLPALWLLVEHKQTLYPCAKRKGLALRDFWLCSGSSRLLSGFASDRAESTAAPAFWQIVYVVERFEMLGDIRVGMTATKSAMFSFGLWCPSNGFNPIFK